jgi:cation transporter-like permease
MYHPFSVVETIKTSWDIFKKNIVTIIVYSIISYILLAVLAVIIELIFSPQEFAATMLVTLILIFVQAYTTLGLSKYCQVLKW